jgi:hypothetical protein
MLQRLKDTYDYVHGSFHGSEVILWSRLQIMIGAGWLSLQGQDLSPILHEPKYILYYAIGSNFINEMLRRRKATYDDDGSIK